MRKLTCYCSGPRETSAHLFEDLIDLNPYAVQFRYEAYDSLGTSMDRDEMVNRVHRLMNRLRAELAGQYPSA